METNIIKTIRVLPIEEMFFLKKIYLENTSTSDIVCYARKLSRGYKLTPQEDPKENQLYLGYSEDEYPRDELDIEILKQIQEKFPHAKPHTSLTMFNVDKEDNTRWLNQYKRETRKISIVYNHSHINRDAQPKEIEVMTFPTIRERQRSFNTNILINTEKLGDYERLSSLLNDTYSLVSKVCK